MNARNKLNYAYVNGSILVAAVLALVFRSWAIFGAALAVLGIGSVVNGGIRPQRRRG
jgi:hypothetical protein